MVQHRVTFSAAVLLASCLLLPQVSALRRPKKHHSSCVGLQNRGSYSTVQVSVGTPPQKFDVVADTGSDNLIVASCACADAGHCDKKVKCFRGTNKSSTFKIDEEPDIVNITFGSGPVQTVVTSDVVGLGDTSAKMEDALLLMVNQQLDPPMALEGILGLGLPRPEAEDGARPAQAPGGGSVFSAAGFLELANVPRFSICFNNGEDGVLQLGGARPRAAAAKPLGSIGDMHWSVGLHGVTISSSAGTKNASFSDVGGGAEEAETICGSASKKSGQKTPCGAIVDSGTTLILAPADQLATLYRQLCEAWPQCKDGPAMSSGQRNATEALFTEVEKCETDEMPTLQFHVSGAEGTMQTLDLPPNEYTIKMPYDDGTEKCVLAFEGIESDTEDNGPVWLFGTPFFYRYTVSHDMSTKPPQITFGEAKCTQCGAPKASLAESKTSAIRTLYGPPRRPLLDTSLRL